MDVSADESVRLLAEVEAMGSAKGVADAAGLLKPKLKPIVDADVVAAVPVLKIIPSKKKKKKESHLTITIRILVSIRTLKV